VKITPLELRKPDFKRSVRGWNPDEVQAMLSSAADSLEELIRENKELKDKHAALEDKVKNYESLESTLNETMILAQKAGDSAREAAQKEAELITSKAEVEAEKMLEKARARLMELKLEVEELEHQKQAYLLRLRSLVASQWKLLQEEKEEEERLREFMEAEKEEVPGQEKAERGTEEIAEKPTETTVAEEVDQGAATEAEAAEKQPEAVSEELGEILEQASPKEKKKDKRRKRQDKSSLESGKGIPEETEEGSEKETETQAKPKLFWEDDSSQEEPPEQEDSSSPEK
jgi:cell division initiation protein